MMVGQTKMSGLQTNPFGQTPNRMAPILVSVVEMEAFHQRFASFAVPNTANEPRIRSIARRRSGFTNVPRALPTDEVVSRMFPEHRAPMKGFTNAPRTSPADEADSRMLPEHRPPTKWLLECSQNQCEPSHSGALSQPPTPQAKQKERGHSCPQFPTYRELLFRRRFVSQLPTSLRMAQVERGR